MVCWWVLPHCGQISWILTLLTLLTSLFFGQNFAQLRKYKNISVAYIIPFSRKNSTNFDFFFEVLLFATSNPFRTCWHLKIAESLLGCSQLVQLFEWSLYIEIGVLKI
jgi:hypothetical protein